MYEVVTRRLDVERAIRSTASGACGQADWRGALESLRILDDLTDLSTIEVEQDGRRARLRTAPGPTIDPVCRALRFALPPVYQELLSAT